MVLVEAPSDAADPAVEETFPETTTDTVSIPSTRWKLPSDEPASDCVREGTPTAASTDSVAQPPPLHHDSDQPPLLPDEWTSAAVQQRRQWILVGTAALVGVILAVMVFGFVASRMGQQDSPSPSTAPTNPTTKRTQSDNSPHSEVEAASTHAIGEPSQQESDPVEVVSTPSEPAADATGDDTAAEPGEPLDPEVHPENVEVAAPIDDAEPMVLEPAIDDATPDTAVAAVTNAIDALAPLVEQQPFQSETEGTQNADAPELDAMRTDEREPGVARPEPRDVDVKARLADSIPSIRATGTPLLDLIQVVSEMTTIPITISPDALALVGATPGSNVSLDLNDTTVGGLLTTALGQLRLTYIQQDEQLLVTCPPPRSGLLHSTSHTVEDLAEGDPAQADQLVSLAMAAIDSDSWESAGGAGTIQRTGMTLTIRQEATSLFRTIVFFDRLRLARGLPPVSHFRASPVVTLTPRVEQASELLEKPLTLNYFEPERLTSILQRVREATNGYMLVDWQALGEIGWTPDGETTLSVDQESLQVLLATLLKPMDLTYRVIDDQTLQVTTHRAANVQMDVEFYPTRHLITDALIADSEIARLRSELEIGVLYPGALLHWDEPSGHLIAVLPQSLQKRLAGLLAGGN